MAETFGKRVHALVGNAFQKAHLQNSIDGLLPGVTRLSREFPPKSLKSRKRSCHCRPARSQADKPINSWRELDFNHVETADGNPPEVGGINPVIIRMLVDFPAPLGPRNPSTSPFSTENETPFTASFGPNS